MGISFTGEFIELLQKPDTVKVLATVDAKGRPHAAVKNTLQIDEKGRLVYLELLESSNTNRNLVRSIWFNHPVSIAVVGADGQSYQIKGIPVKAVVNGPAFRKYYAAIREKLGDVDLAAVWVIEPSEITDQSFSTRRRQEEEARPYFKHLDRFAK